MSQIPKILLVLGLGWLGNSAARTAEAAEGTAKETVNIAPYALAGLAIYLVMRRA